MIVALINDFKSSIKSPDTEEKLDLIIYRPFGYLIAKCAHVLGMTPAMLSILGLLCGIVASYYFLEYGTSSAIIWGSFYFVLSGILDSSDGQLARISNQSTKFGLILDGICDSLVIIAVYISCAMPYIKSYGALFVPIVILALLLHSYQCAILDFYHREYLYFGYGKIADETYWNPGVAECRALIENSPNRIDKIMNSLRLTWIKKQQLLTTRSEAQRAFMRQYFFNCSEADKKDFMKNYTANNLWLLPYWRLVGVNAHTMIIIAFMFMRRFDIFLVAFDLVIFNVIIWAVGYMQKKSDEKFMKTLVLKLYAK